MEQHADLVGLSGSSGSGTLPAALIGGTLSPGTAVERADLALHLVLRAATLDVHERLHRHAGFAAVQDASIGLDDYQDLIARLYGFYVPFEVAAGIRPERSKWLADDLEALGFNGPLTAIAQCAHIPRLDNSHLGLGALYMAEGSALGGRVLARGLDRLLGTDLAYGRRFFIGRGASTGEAWRGYLAQLSAAPPGRLARAEITKGAVETFAAFEHWLDGWSTLSDG